MNRPYNFGLGPDGADWRARYWFPNAQQVSLVTDREIPLARSGEFWEAHITGPIDRYTLRVDGVERPDPFARWLPDGVDGAAAAVRLPADRAPKVRANPADLVILEVHVGTATPEGTFAALAAELPRYRDLGITAVELLPVQQFGGDWGWGYDGVFWFAPHHAYGTPAELARMIDEAHRLRLSVFNDVVYNHLGPIGDPWHETEFSRRDVNTDWGPTPDFRRQAVRDIVLANVHEWLEIYRFDGLRFDAVHTIVDDPTHHILSDIASKHDGYFVLENDANESRWLTGEYDSQWNDDFHHALHVAVTGESGHYYNDFADSPLEHLGRCLTQGFAYQGEHSVHRGAPRGDRTEELGPFAFVNFAQNHDQVGNRGHGDRLVDSAGIDDYWLMATVAWLAPGVPMLFMGEESGTHRPFPFFGNFSDELAPLVRQGRLDWHAGLPGFDDAMPDPSAPATLNAAKLPGGAESEEHADRVRELLRIRREKLVPRWAQMERLSGAYEIQDSVLSVRWPVNVELIINLRTKPMPLPPGTQIASSRGPLAGEVPSRTALFLEAE
ncbi:MAG: alpha-amylase family glycosyl hydrolase [Myxococcota bacterium]